MFQAGTRGCRAAGTFDPICPEDPGRSATCFGAATRFGPCGASARATHGGSARSVLTVASDIAAHPGSAVGEIAERTGLPQSQVPMVADRLSGPRPSPGGQAPAWVSGSEERITDDVEADITAAEAVVMRRLLRTDNAKKVAGIEAHLALRCGP
ncbi:hypothetical protein GCM10015535_59220 [Streptomyces gelaticus]|uniref:MarR family transcriptional regulator n=1 Tax=Streptomyces gelaticus TaxID=285446 RepID=A0ABQ2W6I1_9ACTN|nr:hypothetical protein GCM10015535_59220 [Streptomyces gelaticus]